MKCTRLLGICFFVLSCIAGSNALAQANVLVGRSFVKITRPSGCTVVPCDDQAMYNSSNKTIRLKLGRDTVRNSYSFAVGNASSTSIDTAGGGGSFWYRDVADCIVACNS